MKVLIVSASKVFLSRNSKLLMQRRLDLFTVLSGTEALRMHKENSFDLVISDYELEDMNGCTLCSLLREMGDVPFILICNNRPGSVDRVTQSGASAMLLKPIDPTQLLLTIGRLTSYHLVRSKRVVLQVNVSSKIQQFEFTCFSHDISNTGILVETEYDLSLGDRACCAFTLPDSFRIQTEVEVIRCINTLDSNNLYGFRFVDIPISYRRAIDNYVSAAGDNVTAIPLNKSSNLLHEAN